MIIYSKEDHDIKGHAENLKITYDDPSIITIENLFKSELQPRIKARIEKEIAAEIKLAAEQERPAKPFLFTFLGHTDAKSDHIKFLSMDPIDFSDKLRSILPEKYAHYPITVDLIGCETGLSIAGDKKKEAPFAEIVADRLHEKGIKNIETRAFSNLLQGQKGAARLRLKFFTDDKFSKQQLQLLTTPSKANTRVQDIFMSNISDLRGNLMDMKNDFEQITRLTTPQKEMKIQPLFQKILQKIKERTAAIEKKHQEFHIPSQVFDNPSQALHSNIAYQFSPDKNKTKKSLVQVKKEAEEKLKDIGLETIKKTKKQTPRITPAEAPFAEIKKMSAQCQKMRAEFKKYEKEMDSTQRNQLNQGLAAITALCTLLENRYKESGEAKDIYDNFLTMNTIIQKQQEKKKDSSGAEKGREAYAFLYDLINKESTFIIKEIQPLIAQVDSSLKEEALIAKFAKEEEVEEPNVKEPNITPTKHNR